MRTGKLPEHTFKRSVINPIRFRQPETTFRAGIGHDGAVFGDMVTAMATTAFSYTGNEVYALNNAVNNVIAAGGKPYGVSVAVLLPEHSEEAVLRRIMDNLCKKAEEYQIEILAGQTELVPSVNFPTVTVTAYGRRIWINRHKQVEPGMAVVMTKWTGLYGGAVLAELKAEELKTRYPEDYIRTAAEYMRCTSLIPELRGLETAVQSDCIFAAHDVSNGGVFGALWQLLLACNCGAEFPIGGIPIKQETIEISEYFNLNPYMMNGQGSLLMITNQSGKLIEAMLQEGVAAKVIGYITESKSRKILIDDEERFLGPPKGDALNAVFYGQPLPV
ncbi:MAG: AIR synthase-related protein [Bacteroidales bacterium]|nr:AIR synthase-related protein [Clostridium sp.]MCM1203570.1 AIR synthase-related protein [Bacteroidales bacterium]